MWGCEEPIPIDDNVDEPIPNTNNVSSSYVVYKDSWANDITMSYYVSEITDPSKMVARNIIDGYSDTKGYSLELDFTQLKDKGVNGIVAYFNQAKDISEYNALTMWVKATAKDKEIARIAIENGNRSLELKQSGNATVTDKTKFNIFGDTWRKVTIPIFDSTYLKSALSPLRIINQYTDGKTSTQGTFIIDQIQYEKLNKLPEVDSITYASTALNITIGEKKAPPTSIDIVYNDDTGKALLTDTTTLQAT